MEKDAKPHAEAAEADNKMTSNAEDAQRLAGGGAQLALLRSAWSRVPAPARVVLASICMFTFFLIPILPWVRGCMK